MITGLTYIGIYVCKYLANCQSFRCNKLKYLLQQYIVRYIHVDTNCIHPYLQYIVGKANVIMTVVHCANEQQNIVTPVTPYMHDGCLTGTYVSR